MERVALLAANERENIVKLTMSEDAVVISSRSPLSGSARDNHDQ